MVEKTEEKPEVEVKPEEAAEEPAGEKPTEETTPSPPTEEAPQKTSTFQVKSRQPGEKPRYLNVLIHGDTGTGKTVFCGTMIEMGLKTLVVVFNEDELLTLDQRGLKGYDYIVVEKHEQLWPLYLALRKNEKKYEGLILDGLADFQQTAKDSELAGDGGVNLQFMQEAMKGNRRMFLQNWGNLLEMTRHSLDPILKLPLHKVMTCISEADDDPKTGKVKVYPLLQGSFQQMISAHFSVVGYSYVAHQAGKAYWCITTQPHEVISTKDRTDLCRVLVNPKFQTFLDALNGKKSELTKLQVDLARTLILRPQATKTGGDGK